MTYKERMMRRVTVRETEYMAVMTKDYSRATSQG